MDWLQDEDLANAEEPAGWFLMCLFYIWKLVATVRQGGLNIDKSKLDGC